MNTRYPYARCHIRFQRVSKISRKSRAVIEIKTCNITYIITQVSFSGICTIEYNLSLFDD